jgi:hypothetical protein
MTIGEPSKLLIVGPSSLVQEAAPGVLFKDLLIRDLETAAPGRITCTEERLFFGTGMAPRLQDLLDRHDPGAVLLYLGSGPFELESVVEMIKAKWPSVYRPGLKLAIRLKGIAGGGLEGSPGPRGWLYRLPRRLSARLVGVDSMVSLDGAITSSIEAINVLCRREDVVPLVYFSAVSWPPTFTRALKLVGEFDQTVRAHCRRRGVPYWFRQEEMAKRGFVPQRGSDGIHGDHATYSFEAGMITELILREMEIAPDPGGPDPLPGAR